MGGRRIKTFFFFLLFSIPWGPHRDVPVALAMLLEQPGVGQAGMVYATLPLQMTCTCCGEVEWEWEIGASVGKAKSQPQHSIPRCLSFPQPG